MLDIEINLDKKAALKIKKLLALSDGAGTEAEAFAAMSKAQELLAKHGLNVGDVLSESPEGYEREERKFAVGLLPWKRYVYDGLCALYFCEYYFSGTKRHFIVGKASNIEICKHLIDYTIRSGIKISNIAAWQQPKKERATYKHSFRTAFGKNEKVLTLTNNKGK